jgi:beta-lactam-binding protein with PASTA domain
VRACPNCGRQNPDGHDFCSCGEYLRWEPTGYVPTLDAPATPPRVDGPGAGGAAGARAPLRPQLEARGAVAETVALTLRRMDEVATPDAAGGVVSVTVEPGGRAVLCAFVRNQSGVVDNYDLTVVGLPDGWWSITPPTVYLVPMGAGSGSDEQELAIHIHPPRVAEAVARTWAFDVVVHSRAYGAQAAEAPAQVEITPYVDVRTELAPDRQRGRRRAQFTFVAENRANAPVELRLAARDTDDECSFHFAQSDVVVEPSERVEVPLVVRPPRQIWVGRARNRQFEARATAPGRDELVLPPGIATYRQRSWLPWWLAPVVPLLLVAAAAALLLMPKKTTVPDLRKLSPGFAVQQALLKQKLNQIAEQQPATSGGKPGTITKQLPLPGSRVDTGTRVTIWVVRGSGEVRVPPIVGLKLAAAAAALNQAGLKLGEVLPQPADQNATIGSQIPGPRKTAHPGETVMVFIAQQPPNKTKATKKAAVSIPKVAGEPVAQAAAALAQAGLLPIEVQRYSAAKRGTLIGTIPPADKPLAKGSKITLLVSAGFPELVFNGADGLMVVKRPSGGATPLAGTGPNATEASWSADGTRIAFVSGADVVLAVPGRTGSVILHGGVDKSFSDPTFARREGVLAVVRRSSTDGGLSSDGDLCLSRVGANGASLSCGAPDLSTDVGRSLSWSRDGHWILIAGHPKDRPDMFGLIRYHSKVPFSTRRQDWHRQDWPNGGFATDVRRPHFGALAGAFSPDGKRLAVASNQAGGGYQLYVTTPDDFILAKVRPLPVVACSLAWRPDSAELAVAAAQDCWSPAPLGIVMRVNPAHASDPARIADQGARPAWQPLKLGG